MEANSPLQLQITVILQRLYTCYNTCLMNGQIKSLTISPSLVLIIHLLLFILNGSNCHFTDFKLTDLLTKCTD